MSSSTESHTTTTTTTTFRNTARSKTSLPRKSLNLLDSIPKFNHRRKSVSTGSGHSISSSSTTSSNQSNDTTTTMATNASVDSGRGATEPRKSMSRLGLMGPPAVVPMAKRMSVFVAGSMTLEKVIDDKHWRSLFFQYLCSEHSEESLEFILQVRKIEQIAGRAKDLSSLGPLSSPFSSNIKSKARQVFDVYIKEYGEKEVNLCGATRELVSRRLLLALSDKSASQRDTNEAICVAFLPAKDEISALLRRDSYPRFCKVYAS